MEVLLVIAIVMLVFVCVVLCKYLNKAWKREHRLIDALEDYVERCNRCNRVIPTSESPPSLESPRLTYTHKVVVAEECNDLG